MPFRLLSLLLALCASVWSATADTIVDDTAPSGAPAPAPPAGYADSDFLYQHYVPQADDPQQNGLYYRLYLPRNYGTSGSFLHPLVIFHHGDGEKELSYPPRNQKQLSNNGQFNFCSSTNQATFPCFVAMVQAGWWGRDESGQQTGPGMIAALIRRYRIDPDRVIVTGLSGGGGCSLSWAGQRPDVYAGFITLSAPSPGSAGSYQPMNLAILPGWFFGSRGDSVDVNPSTVRDIRAYGGHPALTVYNSGGHSSTTWNAAYSTPALYPWLNGLRRGQAPQMPVEVAFTAPAASGPYSTASSTVTPAGSVLDRQLGGSSSNVSAVSWYTAQDAAGLDGETALGTSPATGTTTWTANASRSVPGGDTYIVATATGGSLHPTQAGATYYSACLTIRNTGSAAGELDLACNGVAVPDGYRHTVASGAAGSATSLTFVLRNSGAATLSITPTPTISYPTTPNCTAAVTTAPSATLAAGASTAMAIDVTPTAKGLWEFRLSLVSDDGDENPYNVSICGNAGLAGGPELNLSRGGTIADGGSDSVAGSIPSTPSVLSYTLANAGTAALSITTPVVISAASNCSATVTTQPSASVAAGGTTSLVVSVTPTAAGAWSFAVSVANTDANEAPYDWTVSGTAASPAPELDITRGGAIADGGSDPVGGTSAGASATLTYTLANSGTSALGVTTPVTISGQSNCTATVTTQPAASIASGASSSLAIAITPTAAGAWSCAVSVASTDANENPYDWTISGTALAGGGGSSAIYQFDLGDSGTVTAGNWNNICNGATALTACIDSTGAAGPVAVTATGFAWPSGNGVVDSSLYPATAQRDFFYVASGSTGTVAFSGLQATSTYDVTLFASRQWTSTATADYAIGATTLSLNAYNNTTSTVQFTGLTAVGGSLTLTVQAHSGSTEGDLGVIILTEHAAVASAPELDVTRSAAAVADGGSDTVAGTMAGSATALSYLLTNSGTAALVVTTPVTISGQSNCAVTVTTQPDTAVVAGGTSTMVLSVVPAAAGAWTCTVSMVNNDGNEGTYDWTVSGTAASAPAPELDITRGAIAVADASTDAISGAVATIATGLTYTLANSGSATLNVTTPVTIAGQTNCAATVTAQPGTSIGAGATASMVVSVTPTAAGAWSFTVSVVNTDGNENPYDWTVSGTAAAAPAPELDIARGVAAVADGATTTVAGSVAGSAATLTYTLSNSGTAGLSVTTPVSLTGQSNCSASVTAQPATSIAASAASSLIVSVTPATTGAWSFIITVVNDDADEGIYDWTVQGTAGAAPVPELDIARAGVALPAGGSDVMADSHPGTAMPLTYVLANTGTAALAVTVPVAVSAQSNCTATVTTQPTASIAAGATSSLVVSVTPTAIGAWSCAIAVVSSDGDENPYAWTISGTAVATPLPDLDISHEAVPVADGGSETVSGTTAGTPKTLIYELANTGTAVLSLTSVVTISSPVNCLAVVTTQPATTIAAGSSSTLALAVTPTIAGGWACTVTVVSTDGDEAIYTWTVSGMAATAPGADGTTSAPAGIGSSGGCGAGGVLGLVLGSLLCLGLRRGSSRRWRHPV